jgi:hypothetical protein
MHTFGKSDCVIGCDLPMGPPPRARPIVQAETDTTTGDLNDTTGIAGASTITNVTSDATLYIYSAIQGLVVAVLNTFVASLIQRVANLERHSTITTFIDSVTFKLTLFYFLNSFVVPIVVVASAEQLWCARVHWKGAFQVT